MTSGTNLSIQCDGWRIIQPTASSHYFLCAGVPPRRVGGSVPRFCLVVCSLNHWPVYTSRGTVDSPRHCNIFQSRHCEGNFDLVHRGTRDERDEGSVRWSADGLSGRSEEPLTLGMEAGSIVGKSVRTDALWTTKSTPYDHRYRGSPPPPLVTLVDSPLPLNLRLESSLDHRRSWSMVASIVCYLTLQ